MRPCLSQQFIDKLGAGRHQFIGRHPLIKQQLEGCIAVLQGFAEQFERIAAVGKFSIESSTVKNILVGKMQRLRNLQGGHTDT